MPEILFVKEFRYSIISDPNPRGCFVDKQGNIKEYDFTKKDEHISLEDLMIRLQELENVEIIGNIPLSELQKYYGHLMEVDSNSEIVTKETDLSYLYVVVGRVKWYGNRYQSDRSIESILIYGTSDTEYENKDANACLIKDWIIEKLPTGKLYNALNE